MKFISWNIAEIKARAEELRRLVYEHLPEVVCLQKTRPANAPGIYGFPSKTIAFTLF